MFRRFSRRQKQDNQDSHRPSQAEMDETKQDDGSNAKDDDDDILEAFGISTAPSKDSPREYYTASENEDDDDFAEEGDDDADILEAFGVTDPPKESPRGYHSASENKYENDDSDTLEAFGDNGPQEEENSKNQNTVPTDDEDDGDILEAFGVEDSPNQESASSSEDEEDNADILEAFGVEGSPNQESASSSEDEEDNADVLEAFGVTGSPNQESVSPSEDDEDDADILEAFGVTGSPNRESPSEDDEDDADILEAFGVTGSPNRESPSDDDEDDADILETFGVTGSQNQESASPSEDDEDDADILEAFGVTGSSEDEISKEPSIEDDADNADILEAFDFSSPPREVSGVPNTMLDGKDDDEGDGADVLEAFSPSSEEVAEQYIRVASLPVEQLQQNEKQKTMSHSQHAVGSQERRGSFFQLFGSPRPQQRISEAMLEEEKRVKFQIVKDFVGEDKATPPTKWGSLIIDEASKEAERGFKLPEIPLSNDESHLEDSSSSAGSPPSSPRKEKAISGNSPDDTPLQGAEEQESDVDTSHHSSVFGSLRNMFQGDLEIAGADSVDESEHPRTNQQHKLGEESSNPRPTSDVVDKITEDVGSIDEDTKSFKEDQKQDDVIDSSRRSSAFGSLRNLFQGDPATNHTSTEPAEHDAEDQVDETAPQDPVRDNNLEEDEKLDKTNSRVDQEQNDDNAIDMSKRSSVFGSLRDLFQGELERNPKDAKVANGSNQNNIDLIEEIDDSQPDGPIVNPDKLEAQFMTPEPQKSLLGVLGLSSSSRESLLLPKAEEEDVLEETSIEREEITDEIASPQAQKSLLGFPGLSLPQSESKALPELEDEATPEKKDVLNEESKKEKKFVEPEAPTQTLFGFRFLGPKPANAKATEEIQGTKSEESNNSAAIPNNEQQQKSAPSPAKEVAPKQKAPHLFGFFRQGQKQEEAESIRTNPLELEKQKQEERLKLLLGEGALEEQQLAQQNLIQAAKVQESEQPISDQAGDKTNGGNSKIVIKSAGFESFFSPKPKVKRKEMSSKTDASDNKKDVEHTEASQEVAPYVPIVIGEDAYTPKEPSVSVFGSLFSPGRDESSPPEKSLNASSKEEMMALEKSDETKGDEVIEADSVEDAKDTLQVSSRSFVESNENKQGGPRVGVFGSIFNSNRSEGMLSEKDHDEEKSESDTEKYSVEVAAESAKSTGPVVEHMGTKSALELEKERQQKLLMDLLKLDENAMKDQQDQQAVLVSQTVSQKKEDRSTIGSESLEAPKELVATVDENDVTAPKNSRFGGFGSLFVPDARQATSLSTGVTDEPKGGEVIEADGVEDAKDTLQVSSRSFVESNENKQGGPRVGVFGSIFNSNRSEGMLSEKDHDEEKSESDTEKYSVEVAAESAKSTGPVVEHMGTKSALELEKERQQKLLMDLLKLDENAMKDQQDQQAVLVSQTVSQKKEDRSTIGSESLEAPKELVATVDENDVTAPKNSRFGGFGSLFVPDARQATSLSTGVTDEPKGGEVIEADSVEDAKDTLQVSSRSFVESNENKQGGPRVGVFGSIFNSNRSEGMLSEKDHDEEKSESDTEKYSVEVAAESAKSTGPVVEHMGTKSALELEKERQQKLLMDLLKLDENAMKDQQDQQAVLVSQTVSQKKEDRSTLGSESLEAPKELVATVDENDVTAPKNSRFGGFGSLFVPDARQATSLSTGVTDEPKGGEVIEADSVEDAKDTLQVSSRSFVESNENKQGGPRVGVFGSIFNSNRSEGMLSEKDHDEEKSESDTEKYSVEVAAESAKSTGPVVEHMGTKSALELEKERQQKLLMDLLKLDENAMKDQQDQQAVLVSQTVSQKQKKELSERAHDELVAAEEISSPYQSGNRFCEQKPQQQKIADEEEWESSLEPQSSDEAAEEVMPIFDSNLPYSASIETQSRRSNSLALEKEEKQRLMIELLGIDKDQIGMAEQAQEDLILQSLHGVSPTAKEQIDPILDPTPPHEDNDFAEEDGFAISQIESVKQYEPILVVQDVTAQKAYTSAVHDDMVQGNSTSAVRDETFEGAKDQESVSSDIRDESVPQMAENMSITNRGFAGSASPGRLSLIQTVSSRFRPSVRVENDGNRLEIEKQRQQRLLLEQLNLDEGDFQKKQLEQEELIRQCILGRQQDLKVDKVANGVKEKPGTNVAQAIEAFDSIDDSKDEQDSQVLLWWRQKLRDKNDKTSKMVVPSEASVQSELISDLGSTIDSQGSDEDIKVHDNNEPGMDFGSPSQQQDGAISSMIKTKEATTSVVDTKDDTPTKSNMSPIESPCEKEMPTDVGEETNDTVVDIQIDQARSHQSMPSQNAGNESLVKNSDGIAAMNNSYPNKTTKPISSTDSSALASQPSVKSIESPKPGEDSPGERSRSNSIASVDHQHITRRKFFCTDKTKRENSILFAHSAENEDPANNEMDDFVAKDLSGARDSVKMDSNIMNDGELLPKSKPLLQVEQMEVEHEDSNSIRKGFGTPTVLSVAFLRLPEPDVKGTKETNLNKDGPSQVVKSWGSKRVHKFFGTSTVLSDAFLRLREPDLKQMAEENLKANGPLQVTESVDKKRIQKYFGTPTILPGAFLQLQEHGTHQSARKILHGHDSIAVKPFVTQDDLVPNDRSLPKLEENIDILIHKEVDISRTNPKTIQKGFGTPTILPGAFLQLPENNARHQDAKDNLLKQDLLPDQFLVTEDDPVPDDRSLPEWEENNDLLIQKTVDLDMDVEAEVGKALHESDSSVHDVENTGPDKDHLEARVKGSDNGPNQHRIETTEPFKSDQAVDLVAAGDHTASAKDSIEEDIPRVGPLLEIAEIVEIAVAESDENKICALVKQIDTALTAQASKEQESYKREQKHSSDQEGKTVISETDDSADATINISMLRDNDTLDISDNINTLHTVTRARGGTLDMPIHSLAEDATLSEGRRSNSEHSDRLPVDFEAEQPCRLYHGQGSNNKTATTDVKVATEDVRTIDNTRTKVDNKMVQSESSIDGSYRLEDPRVLAFDSAATLIKEPVMLCVNDESEKEVTLGRPSSNMLGTLQMFRDDPIIPSIHVDHETTKEAKLDFDIENLKKAAIEQNDHLQPIIKDTSSRKVERVPAIELQLEDNNLIVTVDGDRVEGAFDISEIRDLEKRERLFADMQSALPGVAISSSQGNQICIRLNLAGRRMGFKVENNKVSLLADPFALPIQNAPWDQIEDENKGIVQSVMSANKAEDQLPEAGKNDSDQKENDSSHLKPHGGSPKPLTVRDDLVKHANDSVQNFRAKNMTRGSKQKEDPPQEQPVPFDEGGSFHSKLSIAPFDEKGSVNTKQMPVPFDERESFNSDSGKTEDTKQSISLDKPHKQARQDLERLDESMDNMPMVVDMERIPNATIPREQYAGIKSAAWQLLNDESQTKPRFLPLWEEASQRTEDVPPLPQVPIALSLDNGGRSSSIRGDLDTPKKTAKNHVSMSEETDRTTASTVKAKDAGKDSKNLNPENNGSDYLARYIAARSKATARARNDLKTTLDTTKTRRKRDPSERINAKKVVPAKICTVDRRVFSLPQNVGTAEPEGIRISPKGKSGAATGAVNTTKSSRFTYPSGELAIVDYEHNARRGRGRGLVSNADSETRKKPKDHQSRQHCDRNVDTSSYSRDSFRAPQSARSRLHPYIWNKGGDEWQQEQLGLGLGLGRPEMYRAAPGAFFYEDSAKDKYSSYPSDLPNAQSRYTSPYLNDLSRQAYGRSALGAYAPNQTTLLRKQKHTSSTNRAKEMDAPITSSDRRFQRKRIKAKMKRLKTTVSKMEDK